MFNLGVAINYGLPLPNLALSCAKTLGSLNPVFCLRWKKLNIFGSVCCPACPSPRCNIHVVTEVAELSKLGANMAA